MLPHNVFQQPAGVKKHDRYTSGMKVLVNGGLNLSELDGYTARLLPHRTGSVRRRGVYITS